METDVDDFLAHFGVKGMRWGQRKDRSLQGRADKFQRVADRRPTRGNIRKAERAQQAANRKAMRKPVDKRQKTASAIVGIGAGLLASNMVMRRTLNTPVSLIAGAGVGVLGARATRNILERDRQRTIAELG